MEEKPEDRKKGEPTRISQDELVGVFKDIKDLESNENRFCFLLGAGASKSSGIPTGWELAEEWYEYLGKKLDETKLEEWEKEVKFDKDNIGAHYPELYQKRFEVMPALGYTKMERLMERAEPSIGYVILAQILAEKKHNFVITTNFDHLVEEAVRAYTDTKPLVVGHEALAEFVSIQSNRPTIIKPHRDLLLHPFSEASKLEKLKEEWEEIFKVILKDYNLLVIGYGGNDESIMDFLKNIEPSKRKPIYWCVRDEKELNAKIETVLGDKDRLIKIENFDELMIGLNEVLEYKFFTDLGEEGLKGAEEHSFIKSARDKINGLKSGLIDLLYSENEILSGVHKLFKGSLKYVFDAQKEQDKAKAIYEKGLEGYPKDSVLLASYAGFLLENKNYEEAGKYYKKATEINPNYHQAYNNWGAGLGDLAEIKEDKTEAEGLYNEAFEKYKKAIEIKPDKHEAYNNWGNGLSALAKVKEDKTEAEDLYKQAFEKYEKAIKLGGGVYNFACHHAIRGLKEKTLYHLENALAKKEVAVELVLADGVWQGYLNDQEFRVLIAKYSE